MFPDEDHEWKPQGPALNADGRLEGVAKRVERIETAAEAVRADEQPLELVMRVPSAPDLIAERTAALPRFVKRRRRTGFIVAGVMLALAVGAFGVYAARRPNKTAPLVDFGNKAKPTVRLDPNAAPAAFIRVFSQPEGAEVTVNGERVGTTPWVSDNFYGSAPRIEIRLLGYRTWRGQPRLLTDTLAVEATLARD